MSDEKKMVALALDPKVTTEALTEAVSSLQRASEIPPAEEGPQLSPFISYDDFQKVVIRIGQVVQAERIKKSKKLLQLTVDFNEMSPRIVISGIGLSFTPEQLVGQKFAFVTNLKPASIMGIESHAMILATGVAEKLTLCNMPEEVPNGSRLG